MRPHAKCQLLSLLLDPCRTATLQRTRTALKLGKRTPKDIEWNKVFIHTGVHPACGNGKSVYRVTHLLTDLGWVDLDLGCSTSTDRWAVLQLLCYPSKTVEHPKSKSTQPRSVRRWVTLYIFPWRGLLSDFKQGQYLSCRFRGRERGINVRACVRRGQPHRESAGGGDGATAGRQYSTIGSIPIHATATTTATTPTTAPDCATACVARSS